MPPMQKGMLGLGIAQVSMVVISILSITGRRRDVRLALGLRISPHLLHQDRI